MKIEREEANYKHVSKCDRLQSNQAETIKL